MSFVLIALLIASLVGGGGTVHASQDALPGDPLYGVKMLVEDARLLINPDEIGDAELHLEFATERLEEAATLVAQGRPDFVEDLMAEYAEEMEAALTPLADGVDEGEMDLLELLDRLEQSLTHHLQVLEGLWLSKQVPGAAKSAIERAIAASDVAGQVLEAVGGVVPHEPPTIESPTVVPPTIVPPTVVPPTIVPPTVVPPTIVPPTVVPPTVVPPTIVPPTVVPPTIVPPTIEPPTVVPPTIEPPTVVPPVGTPTPPIPTAIP